jgi:phage terminase large subunit
VVGTPKGMNNLFYDYFQKAQSDPNWFLYVAKASETKLIDNEELKAALSVMGTAKYNQEFECSFIGNLQGSIYGDIISKLEDNKQIARIPYDAAYPVNTAWDLGFNDSTAIIFYQKVGHAIHIIDYYEERSQPLPHYAQVLKEKDYVYDTLWAA